MDSVSLLLKVLWSPGEVMFLLSKKPRVLAPMLLLLFVSAVAGRAMLMKLDVADATIRMIEKTPRGRNMSDDQKAILRQQINSPIAQGLGIASSVAGSVLVVVIVAAIYFALFTMLGREGGFKAFLSITAFAFIPSIFSQLVGVLRAFTVPPALIMLDELGSLSPAVFVDRDSLSPAVFAAVNSVDLISIWIVCLLVIGYGFVTRKSLTKLGRSVAVVSVFVVYLCLKLVTASLRGF